MMSGYKNIISCHTLCGSQENGRPGLTQPFVRSLFSKQQQGKGRHSEGKASHSRGAGSKAQSPVAPSPGEVERMAKLEEELIKIQHVRGRLIHISFRARSCQHGLVHTHLCLFKCNEYEIATLPPSGEVLFGKNADRAREGR